MIKKFESEGEMVYKIIRNDIQRNKVITLTTMIFVAAAAMLVSLAAILSVNLTGAIDTLMTEAETPHFMQMHSGEIDTAQLANFVTQRGEIAEFQVLEFLNIDGARIVIEGESLADSVQDIGFSVQSRKFDYLLDLDGNIIQVSDGEVYVPICYMQDGTAEVGDKLTVSGKELTVAGFLRDSQMNSLLASSKRLLVSNHDYAELVESGNIEYLIEFRLKDRATISEFENAYIAADLPANGPALTYPLFKTINAISDGLMIAVILLVSALVVSIAFLCIRFTLLAKIEDDYREVGVMKAIGLRVADIKKIYLAEYATIAGVGIILGFALSFLFRGILLENIRLYMGQNARPSLALMSGIVSVLLVFLAIIGYVNSVLKRFRMIPPAEAIRFGVSQQKPTGTEFLHLSKNRLLDTNIFLGVKDVFARKKIYITMLAVLVLAAFIIIVPQNLHNTIASEGFITYMGIGDSDIRIDIQQADHIPEKTADIARAMENDSTVSKYVVLTTKTFNVQLDDGTEQRLKVELGDHSVFPLEYVEGRAPTADDEIALSVTNAGEMKKNVGDVITLTIEGHKKNLTVSGTYSDVTNGGKTAKAVFSDASADTMWSVISAELTDPSLVNGKITEYAERFDFAKVSGIDEYMMQTFGSTIRSIGKASYAAIAVALTIVVLITLLFMRMLVAKDQYAIAVMKAFGFTNSDITAQYVARSVFVLMIALVLGTLLANTLGEALSGAVISTFGASSFDFEVNGLAAYLLSPLTMALAVVAATIFGTWNAGWIEISDHIKE
jgi:putative ABC transport system permease protein